MPATIQLDNRQIEQLWRALLATFPVAADFRRIVFFSANINPAEIVPAGADLRQEVFEVVSAGQREGWLEKLVKKAHEQHPTQPLLRQFVAELFPTFLIGPSPADLADADPFAAHLLGAGRLFINRAQLRDGLKNLTRPGAGIPPRIMAISSELSRCGKSYSYELIRFIALNRQERVAYVDLLEELSLGNGLPELTEQLARKLRADLSHIPQQEAQSARWLRNLAVWLLDQINSSGQFWWLVFDGIDQVEGLPQEIHDFIIRLAQQIEEEFDPACRLVLISYQSEQLPPNLRHRIIEEVIGEEIVPDQMKVFFATQVQQLLGAADNDPQVLATTEMICELALDKLSTFSPESRPFVMSQLVEEVLKELEAALITEDTPDDS